MIQHQNYYAESHTVKTADGYLLELHRIPVGRFKLPDGKKRQPVLLMHGLEACSTNFVSNLWNQSLGKFFTLIYPVKGFKRVKIQTKFFMIEKFYALKFLESRIFYPFFD